MITDTPVCGDCFHRTNPEDMHPLEIVCSWCANGEFRPAAKLHPEDIAEEFYE